MAVISKNKQVNASHSPTLFAADDGDIINDPEGFAYYEFEAYNEPDCYEGFQTKSWSGFTDVNFNLTPFEFFGTWQEMIYQGFFTGLGNYTQRQIAATADGVTATVQYNTGGTAYLRVFDRIGATMSSTALPLNNQESYGYEGTLAIKHGLIVIGIPTANSQTGRIDVYDYDGNLLASRTGTSNNSYYSAENFGHSVAIGNGRIVVGAPEWADSQGNFTGIYEVWSYPDESNNTLYYKGSIRPPVGGQLSSANRYGNRNTMAIAVGCGRIVLGSCSPDSQNDNWLRICDLNGEHMYYYNNVASSSDSWCKQGSIAIGCGLVAVAIKKSTGHYGVVRLFDLSEGGAELGTSYWGKVVSELEFIQNNTATQLALGYGRLVVGQQYTSYGADYTYFGTTYNGPTSCGAVFVYDLDTFDNENYSLSTRAQRVMRTLVHPEQSVGSSIFKYYNSQQLGNCVGIGPGYVMATTKRSPVGQTNAARNQDSLGVPKVFLKNIPTVMTPHDILDLQSMGY